MVAFARYQVIFLRTAQNPPALSEAQEDDLQAAHLAYFWEQMEAGRLAAAGPVSAPDQPDLRGICLYALPTPQEALAWAKGDPMVVSGVMRAEVATWMCPDWMVRFPFLGQPISTEMRP